MTDRGRGPNVRFPPPLLFVGGWAAALGLERWRPFEIDGAGAGVVQVGLAAAAFAAGLVAIGWAVAAFFRARTAMYPARPATALVETGPYRRTRNPMYLGLTAIYFGLALFANLAWPIVLLPAVLGALYALVIRREERYLRLEFGEAYEAYCRRVPRWL